MATAKVMEADTKVTLRQLVDRGTFSGAFLPGDFVLDAPDEVKPVATNPACPNCGAHEGFRREEGNGQSYLVCFSCSARTDDDEIAAQESRDVCCLECGEPINGEPIYHPQYPSIVYCAACAPERIRRMIAEIDAAEAKGDIERDGL